MAFEGYITVDRQKRSDELESLALVAMVVGLIFGVGLVTRELHKSNKDVQILGRALSLISRGSFIFGGLVYQLIVSVIFAFALYFFILTIRPFGLLDNAGEIFLFFTVVLVFMTQADTTRLKPVWSILSNFYKDDELVFVMALIENSYRFVLRPLVFLVAAIITIFLNLNKIEHWAFLPQELVLYVDIGNGILISVLALDKVKDTFTKEKEKLKESFRGEV